MAVALKKEVIDHDGNLYGYNHPEYAAALYNLAMLFFKLKQYEEAIQRLEEVLPIFQRVYGNKHQRTVGLPRTLHPPASWLNNAIAT